MSVHHIKILPYGDKKFKKKCPFKLDLNLEETVKYSEPRYDILVNNKENDKIWNLIESLKNQKFNKNVIFFHIPYFWDKREYAFYALAKGNKIEIKEIFKIIAQKIYPKSQIEFEY